jgi:hypothetical protein
MSLEDRTGPAAAAVRHSAATVRALNTSRELITLLKNCEAALRCAKADVDEKTFDIVERISQHVGIAGELAELMNEKVRLSVQERSGYWEPIADPNASIRRRLAQRVRDAA